MPLRRGDLPIQRAGEIHLYAATLEQPESYRPEGHVHFEEHLGWFDVKDDLPRQAGNS